MPGVTPELRERVQSWIGQDPDAGDRAELRALLNEDDGRELSARFGGRLAFGTAGLRGVMAAGPNRMNRLVVRQSAAGIARYLTEHVPGAASAGVVVIHDARHRSSRFSEDCVEVLSGHGISVVHGAYPLPTPVGVFSIRELGCAAGIVITASHNPPADNGLKLYLGDAAQIIPPIDGQIAAAIDAVVADGLILPEGGARGAAEALPEAVVDRYVEATLARFPPVTDGVRIATTAMHGVGGELLDRVLSAAGFTTVRPVAAQQEPNPDFPTVGFPNPEEPGALDLLREQMSATGADIGLALDPDADRLAVLVASESGDPVQLTGDEVGVLLGEWLLGRVTAGPGRLVVSSVVSSTLLGKIADDHGAAHAETDTGFKWLCRPAMNNDSATQVLAYEEALGYAIGADVRDKDGICAALAMATMAAEQSQAGQTILDVLAGIHVRHGVHETNNFSLRDDRDGAKERRDGVIEGLKNSPPNEIAGRVVRAVSEVFPGVLSIDMACETRIMVRPSGTEPKLKCYCEAVEAVGADGVDAARERAAMRLSHLQAALTALLVS